MSGFGWNQNPAGFSHGRPLHCSQTVIACRLCDKVFLGTQALINHVASHIPDDDDGEDCRRRGLFSNSRLSPPEAGQMMFPQNRFRPVPPVEQGQEQLAPSKASREEGSSCLTKPYIKLLEKRIPKFTGFADEEEEKKWEQKMGKLDLSLRL